MSTHYYMHWCYPLNNSSQRCQDLVVHGNHGVEDVIFPQRLLIIFCIGATL
jgi:hypothetical protein